MLYRAEGSKYILVFNKQQENYKLNQYIQQNACSFATDSGYFWRFLYSSFFYILFSELTHGNLRTEILRLQSSHSVWEASFTGIKDDTIAFIIGLNNKPSSRGATPWRKLPAPIMSDYNLATWGIVAYLHIRHSYFSKAFVQVIILRLYFEIKKRNCHRNFYSEHLKNRAL